MRISICAGGTGGHMFPSCALFGVLKDNGFDVTLVTDTRGEVFCNDISPKIVLETVRFSKRNFISSLRSVVGAFTKFVDMWKDKKPDVVIGFGGLFTMAPLIVAKIFGAKVVICEQNIVVGRANSLLKYIADLKLSAFDIESWKQISMPVRVDFEKFYKPYECNEKIKILVIGGSQGAQSFSKIVPEALSTMDENRRECIEIVQQVADGNIDELKRVYDSLGIKSTLLKFIDNVAEVMADSQLVICRAGASTLSELVEMGRPAVLIPFPSATDNHQYKNALYYSNRNAAWVVKDDEKVASRLAWVLNDIMRDKEKLKIVATNIHTTKVNFKMSDLVEMIERIRRGKNNYDAFFE